MSGGRKLVVGEKRHKKYDGWKFRNRDATLRGLETLPANNVLMG
jgi:hypothetical protein